MEEKMIPFINHIEKCQGILAMNCEKISSSFNNEQTNNQNINNNEQTFNNEQTNNQNINDYVIYI